MVKKPMKRNVTAREPRVHSEAILSLDQFGDGLDFDTLISGDEVTLFPANGNSATLTITLKYSNGQPAPGKTVRCESRPLSLTGGEWRNVNALAPRFGKGERTIRDRVAQGVVRLGVRVTPASAVTNGSGQVQFRLDSFHICGNGNVPATDEILVTSEGGTKRLVLKSAVGGLGALSDNPSGGLTTSGLVGRHLHPQIIQVLKAIGQAWQRVQGKPPAMPNYITVTGASLRWGGLNPPHLTHRFGGTTDVRPIGTRGGPVSVGDAHYHRQATGIIVDFMKQTGASEIRFADNLPGVTVVDGSHRDHIHISWLKSPLEPWLTNLLATSAALKAVHTLRAQRRQK